MENQTNYPNFSDQYQQEETIDLREILEKYARFWKWFLLSIILALALAFIYLRYTPYQYNVSAQILLKDKDNVSPELEAIKDAVSFGSKDNAMVNDQSKILKSRRLLSRVVEVNQLNVQYFNKGRVHTAEVTADDAQITFAFLNPEVYHNPKLKAVLALDLGDKDFKILDKSFVPSGTYRYNEAIPSPFGTFVIRKNPKKVEASTDKIEIFVDSYLATADKLRNAIMIEAEKDNKSKVVNLSLVAANVKKAETILNSLIEVYNTDIQEDNKAISRNTADFINNRLKIIANDLSGVDQSMEAYKTANRINDLQAETGMYMNNNFQVDKEVVSLSAQVQIAQQMIHNLSSSKDALLPANVGLEDVNLNTGIDNYNQLILEKQNLSKSMRESNPAIESINENIRDVKASVKNNLRAYLGTLQTRLQTVENKKGELTARLNRMPQQESGFRKIARQQQIVEAIYLFLLQKREEAEIKSSAKVDAIKIVDFAYSNNLPVSPKKNIVYLGAFILGLALPIGILYLYFMLDTKLKTKKDLKAVYSGPVLGDIPMAEEDQYIIRNNDHSAVAEAFRILRTNLGFMLPEKATAKRILFTSTIPGEGKTFASINLAQILSLSKKKVVLIGADLRSPKLLKYMDLTLSHATQPGLSHLLANPDLSLQESIIQNAKGNTFDIIHSGDIPPNPAELLMSDRFAQILKDLENHYDYILLDAPPISLVGDAQIIAAQADLTLYLVRFNYLDKRMLSGIDEIYSQKKIKNMAAIINGIDPKNGYGYGYGYGYGHFHQQQNQKSTSFWNKLRR